MKKLTLIGAAAVALSLAPLTTACSSSDGGNGGTSAHATSAAPSSTAPASSRPSSQSPSYGPPTSQPTQTQTTTPPAKPTKPAVYRGCEAVANTAAAPACTDYLRSAAPDRAIYYKYARSSDQALAQGALKGLNNWYTGAARNLILNQVKGWDPNYSDNIDVDWSTKVTSGQGATSAGVATLKVTETWKVHTEGGPVLTTGGTPSVWVTHQSYTITLLRYTGGWGVNTIVKG
jgi:hypothetical protein